MDRFYGWILLYFFATSTLFSQQQIVQWEQILKEAKEKNPQLKQAELNLQQIKLKIEKVKSDFYPRLALSASSGKSYSKNFSSDVIYSYNLSLSFDLFNGFSRINNLQLQLLELQIEQENYRRALVNIVSNLRESFINLFFAQENVSLAEKILKRRRQNYELVKLKYESGSEDLGSLLRVEADMSQAEYELKKSQRAKETAIREVLSMVGKEEFIDMVVETNVALDGNVEKLINREPSEIITQIPEYKSKQYQLMRAQLQAKLVESNFYPTLSFSASCGLSDTTLIPSGDRWNASLNLRASYNIFNGFKNLNDLQIANNNIKIAEFELYSTKLTLLNNFYVLKNNFIDAKELLVVREKYLHALEKQSEIISLKYANGLATYYDWYQVEESFINMQKSLLNLKKELILSELNLKKYLGWLETE
jgi:outer membrane protein TolC